MVQDGKEDVSLVVAVVDSGLQAQLVNTTDLVLCGAVPGSTVVHSM